MKVTIRKHFDYLTPFDEADNDEELAKILCLKYPKACSGLETEAEFFADTVEQIRKYEAWRTIGFESFERFCQEELNKTIDEVDQIVAGVRTLQAQGNSGHISAQDAMKATRNNMPKHGEIGNGRKSRGDNVTSTKRGNGQAYLASRIKRDHPEIAEAVERGEYKSIRAAAIAAGIVKPSRQITIPQNPQDLGERLHKIVGDEYMDELCYWWTNK